MIAEDTAADEVFKPVRLIHSVTDQSLSQTPLQTL